MKNIRKVSALSAVTSAALLLAACGGGGNGGSRGGEDGEGFTGTLSLAPQFGMAYLPHVVMMEEGILEQKLPDATVEEVQLSGGGAVIEQIISGSVDIGYMGIGPFLKGVDGGADVKAVSCLEEMPLELMTTKEGATSIEDLEPTDRIALPGPSSQQAYTLRVAAMEQLGDPNAFDQQMIGLPHPDAMAALLGGQDVTAHFTQPPFIGEEERAGATSILNSIDVWGQHCLIVAVARGDFAEEKPEAHQALLESLQEAIDMINENPEVGADALAAGGDQTPREYLLADITAEGTRFTTEIRGLQNTADKMKETGDLNNDLVATDLVFEGVEVID